VKLRIRALDERTDRTRFSSGSEPLDEWFHRQAGQSQRKRLASVWTAAPDAGPVVVVGYYSLAPWQIAFEEAPPALTRRLPKYPLAATLLARLAVDRRWQGQGMGGVLLADALRRVHVASRIVPVQMVVVHAKDPRAAAFYARHGFQPFPRTPLHLFMPIASIPGVGAA
jgi:GNAT superfamily N-acetyltransferase